METAKIIYAKSLSATLMGIPVGEQRMIPDCEWSNDQVRNRAAALKRRQGKLFKVECPTGCVDSLVTRIK